MSSRIRSVAPVVLFALVAALLWFGYAWWAERDRVELTAEFTETVGLYPGSDVQVLGVSVGEVTSVEPDGPIVRVGMKLDSGVEVAAKRGVIA